MEDRSTDLLLFLQQGSHLLDLHLEEVAHRWQISSSEAKILFFLSQFPHLNTARDVARHCSMSKASVSGNVLKLATRGLLTVDVDLTDRRFQHLTPTELASPIREDLLTQAVSLVDQLLAPLSPAERTQLLDFFSRMHLFTLDSNSN